MLAAQRAGLSAVILPNENEADLEDIPAETREQLEFILADTVDEALAAALDGEGVRPRATASQRKAASSSR